jgi:hypothetical protein
MPFRFFEGRVDDGIFDNDLLHYAFDTQTLE